MRKVIVLIVLVAAVLYFVPAVRQRIFGGVRGTVSEWTAPDAGPVKGMEPVKVYVPRGDSYYHLKNCPRIAGSTPVVMALQEAREMYKPCPVCKPPR